MAVTNPVELVCPHCHMPLESADRGPWPAHAERCPTCRLVIGAGRARPAGEGGARGAAAGVVANAARHGGEPRSPDDVARDLVRAADKLECAVQRLLMIDYRRLAAEEDFIDLPDVLATFGRWKAARSHAAELSRAPAGSPAR